MSVVVPFRGDREAAKEVVAALGRLRLHDGDELVIADNSDEGAIAALASEPMRVVRAVAERSSYHARNAGARAAGAGEWLLFVDADCVPEPDLLDAYFAEPLPADCGLVGGQISADRGQEGLLPRYARARNFLSQTEGLHGKAGSAAATANLLVRRQAFDSVGGFVEGIRSGGDVDLCWRLMGRGWKLRYQPAADVVHRHRDSLVGFLRQVARYGAGARWLDARYPGASPRWGLVGGLRNSARDIGGNLVRGQLEEATYRMIDSVGLVAHNLGYVASNAVRRTDR